MPRDPQPFLPALGPVTRSVLFHDFAAFPASDAAAWARELPVLVEHRLAATALRHARETGVALPGAVEAALQASSFDWAVRTRDTVVGSGAALDALRRSGMRFVVTKGPGIASAYRGLTERPYSDLDVLLATTDFDRARRILTALGLTEEERNLAPWPFFDRLCREAVNLRGADGASIDVHHHVPPWYWGRHLRAEEVVAEAEVGEVMGLRLECASARHNLVIAGLHVVSDRNRPGRSLIVWRDLLCLAAACDPDDAAEAAAGARLAGWLHWVLASLPGEVRPARLMAALAARDQPVFGRRRLELLLPPRVGSRHLVGQVLRLPLPNGMAFLAGTALPSRRFVVAKAPSDPHPYRRWWRDSLLGLDEARRAGQDAGPR